MDRRHFLAAAAALPLVAPHAGPAAAQSAPARTYTPVPGAWRTFEVTTRLEILFAGPDTKAWIPVPALTSDWQQSLPSTWSGNVRDAAVFTDPTYGAKMVRAAWADSEASPVIEVVTRVRTRDRSVDWAKKSAPVLAADERALITKAQHCRAEVWLAGYGWVAMDPADVAKVMRQETASWIKDPKDALVAPVYGALFGAWEGNWMGYNDAHDLALPGTAGAPVPFLMYPQAEARGERVDSLDPDTFKYRITAREITA